MAIDSIKYLEEIDGFLTQFLDNRPGFTNVVISDTLDSANGFARVIPYNLIHIYPFSPEVTSELGNYKSWLYILLLHEYVHIVHIDTKGVIPKFINKIFGKVMAPNQILPRWITEGIAVYFESLLTNFGRINSSYYKMVFRTSILNHDISLAELTNFSNHYPYGGTAYLYGSFFIDYIFKYDTNFNGLAKFSKNYGANIIPYGINRALKQAKGVTFGEIYKRFKKFYLEKYKNLESKIKKEGITKYKTILKFDKKYILPISHDRKISGQNVSYMTLSDKNELYLVTTGSENSSAIYKYSNNRVEKIINFDDSVSNIEVLDDKLFYVTNTIVDNRYLNRFMVLDLKNKNTIKLNNNLRVVNFRLNPYKYEVILVVNEIGIQNLYSFNLQTKKYKKLTNFKESTTIDIPTFVSKDELILTMNKGEDKFWNLYSFNLKSNQLKEITDNNFYEFSPDCSIKDNILNIISDREDDILNIYQYNFKTKEFRKKTNFLTGLKQAIYDGKNRVYYALRYQADNGFEAIEIKESDTINKVVDRKKYIYYDFLANKRDIKYKKIDFSIFPEIFPKNFYPQLQSSNFENSISLIIANSDVREYVGYNLYISYLFDIKDILFSFAYSNFYKTLSYSFAYSFTPLISENFIVDGEKTEYNAQYHTFFTNLIFPLFDYYGYSQLYLGISYRYYTFSKLDYEFKPWQKIPVFPLESDKVRFSFGYFYSKKSSLLKTPGTSKGTSLNLRFTLREKELYATYNSLTFAMQFKHYIPLDFLNGAIAIRYNFSVLTSENGLTKQSIGGMPDNGAITDKLIDRTSISGNYLRGYPVGNFKGTLLNLLNIEYRQHLLYPKIGYDTLPFYIHEIYFRTFYDVANITDSFYELDTKSGVGGEVVISFILSYYGLYNMAIGYSKGLDDEGINHFYLNFISLF